MKPCTDCNQLIRHCQCGWFGGRCNDSNNGFWNLPADERADRMRAAAERGGAENFFDLPPDERAQAYNSDRGEDA